MRILADEKIHFVYEAFSTVGEVHTMPGRAIRREHLREVDVLLTRSLTRVNRDLLEGTSVRFVGTCTSGEDHIDRQYLAEQRIAYAAARGCNADSVAEYIIAALLELANSLGFDPASKTLGIIGVGHVGSRVLAKARALGIRCVLNDEPLAGATCEPCYRPLDEVLACDIITLHVPLERGGPYPTYHLVNDVFLAALRRGTILINAARGAVVDNRALKIALLSGGLAACVLDVWEGEPTPDPELIPLCALATPHIAGYSYEGHVNGTVQIYQALCRYLGVSPTWTPDAHMATPNVPKVFLHGTGWDAVRAAVKAAYDITRDDRNFRRILTLPAEERGAYFDRLRKEYPVRREFSVIEVHLEREDPVLRRQLTGLGFRTAPAEAVAC